MEIFKIGREEQALDKILRDKALNIAKNSKYDYYGRDDASIVYNFFH